MKIELMDLEIKKAFFDVPSLDLLNLWFNYFAKLNLAMTIDHLTNFINF